jgi:lipoate-protein ligase A
MQTDFVRRPTGGRAVLHDDELTYMIAVPTRATGGARETYRAVNRGLAVGIRSLGVEVDLEPDRATPGLDAGPCFQIPAGGEVVAAGRKLIGSAQARIGSALLQHGSIILGGDPSPVGDRSGEHHRTPAATLHELVPGLAVEALRTALVDGVVEALGGAWTQGGLDREELHAARTLERERYGTEAWTWRR